MQAKEKSIPIILNVCLLVMIIMTGAFFLGLFTELGPGTTMRWVVAAGVILFSDLAFVGIAVAMMVARKHYPHMRGSNTLLAWLTIPALSLPPVTELYDWATGPVSDVTVAWLGIAVTVILSVWTWLETIRVHRIEQGLIGEDGAFHFERYVPADHHTHHGHGAMAR